MVDTLIDEVYREISHGMLHKFDGAYNINDKMAVLNLILGQLNITKCTIMDLEMQQTGASTYLIYLLQTDGSIDFDICPHFKMWYNRRGKQTRCRFNTGPIQVRCYGQVPNCENKEAYDAFERNR